MGRKNNYKYFMKISVIVLTKQNTKSLLIIIILKSSYEIATGGMLLLDINNAPAIVANDVDDRSENDTLG